MLKNMKIRSKLILGFGAVLIIAVVIAVYGITSLTRNYVAVNLFQEYPTQRYNNLNEVSAGVNELRRIVATMSFRLGDAATLNTLYNDAQVEFQRMLGLLNQNLDSLRADPRILDASRTALEAQTNELIRLLQSYRNSVIEGMYHTALVADPLSLENRSQIEAVFSTGIVYAGQLVNAMNTISANTQTVIDNRIADIGESTEGTIFTLVVIAVIGVIVGVAMALIVASGVSKPVNRLVKLVDDVVAGNLNINMDESAITNNELGVLTKDIYMLINTIKNINDELRVFSKEIGVNGDYEYRMDFNKYKGAYKDLIREVNEAVDGAEVESWVMMEAIQSIGKGEFDITPQLLPGKRRVVNEALDVFLTCIRRVVEQTNLMIEAAAVRGDMEFHVEEHGFEGGWLEIMKGLNQIAEAVDRPIVEIRDAMHNLSQGKFDKKVVGNHAGDFKVIKDAVNVTIDTLKGYVNEIAKVLTAMSAGDLRSSIKDDYKGDFMPIKTSINDISETLRKAMSEISSAAKYVAEGADKITTNAIELADGSSKQAVSLEELNTAVELIDQQTKQFAIDANDVSQISKKSTENALEGNESMSDMLTAIEGIKESSGNISSINKTIQDIAFQTNLLALNASVEAARAGVHGAGFAVVADEVRTLAMRSQQSASETTELIEDSISRVERGVVVANATSGSLEAILTSSKEVTELIDNITKTATDQADMISQISATLLHTANTVQDNSKFAQDAAATAEELNSQSQMLQEFVAFFKL
ncbi:MAG: methyl-accepting chemotaxis protein [Defluviitaleaceae bacterium]|nr:methyl-accepting chemotaxis protein [Defluviitaleaceae bacterium]